MFLKLLKYDLKYIWRVWWILAVILGTLTLPTGLMGQQFMRITTAPVIAQELALIDVLLLIAASITFMVYFFALAATVLVTELLCYWRFYQHCYSDQGYLTFTLPVSRRTVLLSKVVNHAIWMTAQLLLVGASLFLVVLLAWSGAQNAPPFFQAVLWLFSGFFADIGGWVIVYLLLIPVVALAYIFFSVSMAYFFITLGAVIFKKLKLLGAFGLYYLTNWLFSGILQFVSSMGLGFLAMGLEFLLHNAPMNAICATVFLIALLGAVIIAAVGSIFYCVTQILMDRRLNLA